MFKSRINKPIFSSSLFLVSLILYTSSIKADTTPSDVYHKASMVNAEIALIRKNLGVKKKIRNPILQTRKKPVHVYSKSLELMEKISKLQEKHGIEPAKVPTLPIASIKPEQVLALVETIYAEILRVKNKIGITESIANIEYYHGRTPSNVYENIWQASYLIDGMIKPISPSEVFKNAQRVQNDLNLLAKHLKTELPNTVAPPQSGKRPKQVHLQGYINLHKLSLLEKKLNMDAFSVPLYPKAKVTPSDVYDTTNMMLAELNRIKLHLGINEYAQTPVVSGRKKPAHVLAQMDLINDQVDHLSDVLQKTVRQDYEVIK